MNYLLNYLELLFESKGSEILFSPDLRDLLKVVSSKMGKLDGVTNVAEVLLLSESSNQMIDTYTLIDIHKSNNDTVTMSQLNRIERFISTDGEKLGLNKISPERRTLYTLVAAQDNFKDKVDYEWINKIWTSGRTEMKIGRYAKRIFTSVAKKQIKDSEIETFVNLYKSSYDDRKGISERFEFVSGEEIKKWYLSSNYQDGGGTLNNSCMRYRGAQTYFDIYIKNPEVCKLMILKNDDELLVGRALLWRLSDGRNYLDRIYTSVDSDAVLFREYAESKGWSIYNKVSDITVSLGDHEYDEYPYMDTFMNYNFKLKELSSEEEPAWDNGDYITLQETDGSYRKANRVWSEYLEEYLEEDESVWCSNINSHMRRDDCAYLEYIDEWAYLDDSIVWSEYEGKYYKIDDAIHSELIEDWLYNDGDYIMVHTNSHGDEEPCPKNRNDLYFEMNGSYYQRSKYILNPITNEYIFTDEKIDGVNFKVYYKNYMSEELGDEGSVRAQISNILKPMLVDIPEKLSDGIKSTNGWSILLRRISSSSIKVTTSDVLQSLLNREVHIPIGKEWESKLNDLTEVSLSSYSFRNLIDEISREFDWSLLGTELYKRVLYLRF